MRIEEVAIDGFKSYAKRVVVNNFDKSFNAITGLNGSGKSNILDSLCFVMGIKKLDTVRESAAAVNIVAAVTACFAAHALYKRCNPCNSPVRR